jgi:hypothetical protein
MRSLDDLAREVRPANLDERPLVGLEPWRRLRVGEHRVIFRPLTRAELAPFPQDRGFLIERVVPRGDLGRATKGLR